ncbi:aromatic-ring-hydroxylating dioxygenase subunit beta [Novosphingobium sp. Gsoil 351]|uniref:aromatic-ring-hydroxylating dioxygenase subunit beta n=1 Tax=Novosphingobium sp. Gsoil 351 TaxID=2675225 RepID=UPI001E63C6A3|nr:aromatic-ring-hydroxylating dioxygenase subunit beta [Novosphingobium sp. Gsoil 351]
MTESAVGLTGASIFAEPPSCEAIRRPSDLFGEIEAFLCLEADLMDQHAYDDWLSLWHPLGLYWVPSNSEDLDSERCVSIIFERYEGLEDRIFRLKDKRMHSQSPKSKLVRIVSNFSAVAAGVSDILVRSNFVLGEVRGGQQQTLFGRATHRLIRSAGGLKIAGKKVYLIGNDAPMRNVTFLL